MKVPVRNASYWQDRFVAVEAMRNKQAKSTVRKINPAFDKALRQMQKEIEAWYGRYAENNNISIAEAKRQLNTRELDELRWDIEDYIKAGRENALDQRWLKELENASAKLHVTRLEALRLRTQQAAELAFQNELDTFDRVLADAYTDGYYHTAYEIQRGVSVGFDIGQLDTVKLAKLLKKPWTLDRLTFSDRIWRSKEQLIDKVSTELTQMCILGGTPDQAIKNIAHSMKVSKGQAGRLVMTEAAYFGSRAQNDCYKSLGVEYYELVATLDSETSEICRDLDGAVLPVKDYQAGVTAPPFHPWCRTVSCPYFDDEFTVGETRAAKDENGKTYYVPSNMKYNDWKACFVDKTKDPADFLKAVKTSEDVAKLANDVIPSVDDFKLTEEDLKITEILTAYQPYEYGQITKREAGTIYKAMKSKKIEVLPETVKQLYNSTEDYIRFARERYNQNHSYFDDIYNATALIHAEMYEEAQKYLDDWEQNMIAGASKKSIFYKYKNKK